jgi:transcription elongation factor Elf1
MTRTVCPDCGHATHVTADNRLGNHPGLNTPRCSATGTSVTTPTFEGSRKPTAYEQAAERYRKREAERQAREERAEKQKAEWAELVRRAKAMPARRDEGYAYPRIHVVSGGLPGHGRRR